MADADNLSNYNFSYIDSLIEVVKSVGAEPFITMDYMPFTLSRNNVPNYRVILWPFYQLGYDNNIRNAPPRDNAVYGRVMYQFIKYCYEKYGVRYFEHWNEPDMNLNVIIDTIKLWRGDRYDLYNSYAAIADEVSADAALASNIKLGGCSFVLKPPDSLMSINFLKSIKDNKKKFDFLSFHPYSDLNQQGGYDSSLVKLAIQLRNTYVPNAELINAEWGVLTKQGELWGDLDYGLYQFSDIIDMLNRGIVMSHRVCMFDVDRSNNNSEHPGLFRVGPIVPKSTAYVFYNLNKMNDALNRLPLSINHGMSALAGKSDANDKVVVIFPAEDPDSATNTVKLSVSNLPWGSTGYYIYRYELTEESYLSGVIYNLTYSTTGTGNAVSDSFSYASVRNSGRLVIWEISSSPTSGLYEYDTHTKDLFVYPNPNQGSFFIESKNRDMLIQQLRIVDATGRIVYNMAFPSHDYKQYITANLEDGLHYAIVKTNKGNFSLKILVQK